MKSNARSICAGFLMLLICLFSMTTVLYAAEATPQPPNPELSSTDNQEDQENQQSQPTQPGQDEQNIQTSPDNDVIKDDAVSVNDQVKNVSAIPSLSLDHTSPTASQIAQNIKNSTNISGQNSPVSPAVPQLSLPSGRSVSADPESGTITLDISRGSIIISDAGYIGNGNTEIQPVTPDAVYVISGDNGGSGNNVTIKSGKQNITLAETKITVSEEKVAAFSIESGASVSLLVNNTTALKSGNYAAGLQVEKGASVNIQGTGQLNVTAGTYAAAIGGYNEAQGGTLTLGEGVSLFAYSKVQNKAINMTTATYRTRVAQGSLISPSASPVDISLENVDSIGTKYLVTLPADYMSFAVSTTSAPGRYVSYLQGDDTNGKLLTDNNGHNVYDLTLLTSASLNNLEPKVATYKITFNSNGGNFAGGGTSEYKSGVVFKTPVGQPSVPTRDNHTLAGWYTSTDYTKEWNFGSDTVVQDMTLYARWKPVNCTIKFVTGTSDTIEPLTRTYTDNLTLSKDVVKDVVRNGDMVLAGWYVSPTAKESWRFEEDGNPDRITEETTTLYAKWLPQYLVTYSANVGNGITVTDLPSAEKVTSGSRVKQPILEPKRTDYTFRGWYKDSGCKNVWSFANDIVSSTTTLYAKWTPDYCKVTFEKNGGSEVSPVVVPYDTLLGRLGTNPTKTPRGQQGDANYTTYTFRGWYKENTLVNEWDFDHDTVTSDITLYAKYTQDSCYATLDFANGENKQVLKFDYNNPIVFPTPEKEGYQIKSWRNTITNKDWNVSQPITEDVSLIVIWEKRTYTVTFDPQNGAGTTQRNVVFGDMIPKPAEPKKPGYIFKGWYTSDTFAEDTRWPDDFKKPMVSSNITLYAKWAPIEYTIMFDVDGGSPVTPDRTYHYDEPLAKPDPDPTKEHYTFGGWFKDPAKLILWDFNNNVGTGTLTEDLPNAAGTMTLYAKWIPDTYTVIFHTGVGEPAISETTQRVEYLKTVKAPNYPESPWLGYTLDGWYTEDTFENKWVFDGSENSMQVDKDMDLYAKWIRNEYTVTFITGDESIVIDPLTPVYYNDKVTEPQMPERMHYIFDKWYKDEEAKEPWDFQKDTITGDLTLRAEWIPVDYTFTFEIRDENDVITTSTKTAPYNTLIEAPVVDKRNGYTFHSWYKDAGLTPGEEWNFETDKVDGQRTLYAKWTKDLYTVTFDTSGGEPVPDTVQCFYDDQITKPEISPVKEHYTFGGWYHEAAGETEWNFETEKITGNTTIYAKWIPDIYKVTFVTNKGTKVEPLDVTYGDPIGKEYPATKLTGFHLLNWCTDVELNIPWDIENALVESDMTLYAKWEWDEYTLTYDFGDGTTVLHEGTFHYGDYAKSPDFKQDHKTLNGWFADETHDERWVFKRDKIVGNTVIYAYWTDTDYTLHYETNGGTEIPDTIVHWGDLTTEPADPVREGHTFEGWFKDLSTDEPWDFKEGFIEGNTTIYAKWTPVIYAVTFDADGGEPSPDTQNIAYGSLIPEPENPAKEGFDFKGWTGNGKAKAAVWNFAVDTVAGDTALIAQWEAKPVETPPPADTNNGGGGSGTDNSNTPTDGSTTGDGSGSGAAGTNNGTDNTNGTDKTSGSDTLKSAADTLKAAADSVVKTIKSISTGDNAPLTFWILVVIVSGGIAIRLIFKHVK